MPHYATLNKYARPNACVGDFVDYTIVIENINAYPLRDIVFTDTIPSGLVFKQGSVEINNQPFSGYDPNYGFPLPVLEHSSTVEVKFIAEATFVPTDNPAINIARINFNTHTQDGPINDVEEVSNPVPVIISDCGCDEGSCEDAVCKIYSISLPFTVKPFAKKERAEITCFGNMMLRNGHIPCQDPQHEFEYTLTQRIKVELPVAFGAEVCYEEPCAEDDGECQAP